jgi:small-conductance mechanosensitive channel
MMRKLLTACTVIVFVLLLAPGHPAQAASLPGLAARPAKKDAAPPAPDPDAPPEAQVAGMTDAQARKALVEALRAREPAVDAAASGSREAVALFTLFEGMESGLRGLAQRGAGLFSEAGRELAADGGLVARLTAGQGPGHLAVFCLKLAAALLACLWAAGFSQRLVLPWLGAGRALAGQGRIWELAFFLAQAVLRSLAAAVFYAAGFMAVVVLFPAAGPDHDMAVMVVVAVTYVLLVRVLALCILSPDDPAGRPAPMADADVRTLYRWLMAIAYGGLVCAVSSGVLNETVGAPALARLAHAGAGVLSGGLLAAMVLANRERVSRAIREGGGEPAGSAPHDALRASVPLADALRASVPLADALRASVPHADALRASVARLWHIPALAYALAVGFFWTMRDLVSEISILRLVLSLFLIPACIGLDVWVRRLMAVAAGEDRQVIPLSPAGDAPDGGESTEDGEDFAAASGRGLPGAPEKRTIRHYLPLIKKTLRAALVVLPLFAMLRVWGVEIPLGWLFARNVASILLVVVAGLLTWEIIRIRIDRKLKEEMSLTGEELEEGGGAGGSRSATLLMLLRKFLLTVIVVMGSLVVLSSLGVDIGPLIAGAGVIGLAIGFGAQTLVKDIISGVFFLIDDAFRVGDYVEAGTAKGTVEQISLRSMKLRHPRGMIFTIPYGGLKIIQNFSRDYIISKLDFRVKYDADIDKIRKIIKRINKEIMANEELRPGMLSDIKSMGVRKMEDSAMILRIKFKTVPGHQFLVQKELYRRVQEAFRQNNIDFAHRNVTVYLPPEVQSMMGPPGTPQAEAVKAAVGGAAALAAEEQAVREAAKKPSE